MSDDNYFSTQVLEQYLNSYVPVASPDSEGVIYKTSLEIQAELSDIILISLDEITGVMLGAGYHLGFSPDHRIAWLMSQQ